MGQPFLVLSRDQFEEAQAHCHRSFYEEKLMTSIWDRLLFFTGEEAIIQNHMERTLKVAHQALVWGLKGVGAAMVDLASGHRP